MPRLRKVFKLFFVLLILGIVTGSAATLLLMRHYDIGFAELLNRAAHKTGLFNSESGLIRPKAKYADQFLQEAVNKPYPRILFTGLRNWNGDEPAQPFLERTSLQKQRGDGFKYNCDRAPSGLLQALFCQLSDPSKGYLPVVEEKLSLQKMSAPKAAGTYGDAWFLALVYDLARANPHFSDITKNKLEIKFRSYLDRHFEVIDAGSASLWHNRASIAASAYLLACTLDMDVPSNRAVYSRAYGHFLDTLNAVAITETWPGGYNYWLNNRGTVIALALAAFQNMAQTQAQRDLASTLMRRLGEWHIYLTRPDNKMQGWADEGPRIDLGEGTRGIIDILAQATQDPELASYSEFLKKLHPGSSYYRKARWQIPIFNDPTLSHSSPGKQASLEDAALFLPLAKLFGADFSNHLVIRSGWQPDDTFITFRASNIFTHHQHYDAGHFTLFKGAPLAVSSGTYAPISSPHRIYYAIRSIAKNTLLIVDPEERFQPNHRLDRNVNDGGQRLVIPTGSAVSDLVDWFENEKAGKHFKTTDLLAYKHIPGVATYIKTDITRAYNSIYYDANGDGGKVKAVQRSLLYLYAEDSLVILDRVVSTSPDYVKKWLLHTYQPFEFNAFETLYGTKDNGIIRSTQNNKALVTRNQNSFLKMNILKPENPVVTQIGGFHFRYYVDYDGDDSTFNGENFVEGSSTNSWFEQPLWRTEITSSNPTPETDFLVVLQPSINTPEFPSIENIGGNTSAISSFRIGHRLVVLNPDCGPLAVDSSAAVTNLLVVNKPSCLDKMNVNNRPVTLGAKDDDLLSANLLSDPDR